ncbi:unnamed protein product [Cyprideis torosa]|uniref:Uncharacterized protein n=1 Tax=Cyprideis torosa TaxID=163714 RepID=A0A7R8W6Z2_9CRUS|nr:unnamed protein product [Cyprideis torosa]CAG0885753.1 unnamed protein product [Cyprideis torosa]
MTLPYNILTLTGNFSYATMHSWVYSSLPEVPEKPPAEEPAVLHFISTFLDTMLECSYQKGKATFRSDNISTISILKDFLSKQATANKIQLIMAYDVCESSIPHVLQLLHPKLEKFLLISKQISMVEGLREIQLHEQNIDFLAPEFGEVLENADALKEEYQRQPCYLDRLFGMITDLYIDKFKFKGLNVKGRIPQLLEQLEHYDLMSLTQFFATNP